MNKSLALGIVIGLALLAAALREIDPRGLREVLTHVHWTWIMIACFCYGIEFFLRSMRWSVFLRPVGRYSPVRLFSLLFLGFFINLAGLRAGELARAYVAGRTLRIPKVTMLATIVVERIFDVATLLIVVILATFSLKDPRLSLSIRLIAIATLLGLIVVLYIVRNPARKIWIPFGSRLNPRWSAKVEELLTRFQEGLGVLQGVSSLMKASGLSLLIWGLECFVILCITQAVGISLPLTGPMLVLTSLALGSTIPTPGGMGTFEGFGVRAFLLLQVPATLALAATLLLHAFQLVFIGSVGTLCLWKEGFHWREVDPP